MPYVEVNGRNLYFERKGAGPVLVFVHGPVLPGETFRPQLEGLSAHYDVIVIDLRGHGLTDPSLTTWNVEDIVSDLHVFLSKLGLDRIWLCGYSAGGCYVIEFTARHRTRVCGVILIGSVARVEYPLIRWLLKLGARIAMHGGIPLLALLGAWINADRWSRFVRLYKVSLKSHALDVACFYNAYLAYNGLPKLPMLNVPVLLLYGERDWMFKRQLSLLCRLLPDADWRFIAGAGHEIPSVAGQALNQSIHRFIGGKLSAVGLERGIE